MKNLLTLLMLLAFILASCSPRVTQPSVALATATPFSPYTPVPTIAPSPTSTTQTLVPSSTVVPTVTSTPIPTIQVGDLLVLDPLFSNPELFDLKNPNSPIVQFANAFSIRPEDVIADFNFYAKQDIDGNAFVVMVTSNGTVLIMAERDLNGEFIWQAATPGNYWHKYGKYVGLYLNGDQTKNHQITEIVSKYFNKGILSLNGQVRPGPDIEERKPANSAAIRSFQISQSLGMALNFHYVVEPGKFPEDISKDNIDQWLHVRLSDIAEVLRQYQLYQPVLISFNEPWVGNSWNPESNPLRDKYGNKWLTEYIFQALDTFIANDLVPNQDFILMINDHDTNPSLTKQDIMHDQLFLAREEAFVRLMSDPIKSKKLADVSVLKAEDLNILLGFQGHMILGSNVSRGTFEREPTLKELNALADHFADLGGVIFTEVNPTDGDDSQKREFLAKVASVLASNRNFKGVILWNLFRIEPDDIFLTEPLLLFNLNGTPTSLFYEFLKVRE